MTIKTSKRQKLGFLIFNICVVIFLIEAGMRLFGFGISAYQSYKNTRSLNESGIYKILCIGESTTFSGTYAGAYPQMLQDYLNGKDLGVKFKVINEGKIGVNTSFIQKNLREYLDIYRPHMVIAMMGINDEKSVKPKDEDIQKHNLTVSEVLQNFKVYNLVRHVWLHARTKFSIGQEQRYMDKDLNQAFKLVEQLKFEEAKIVFQEVLARNPNDSTAYWGLGNIYADLLQNDHSISLFEKAIQVDPKNQDAHSDLISRFYYTHQYEKALQLALQMIGRFPDSVDAHEQLAQIYFKMKKFSELEELLVGAEKLFPNNSLFQKVWASYHLVQGEDKQAEGRFFQAAQIDAQNVSDLTISNYTKIRDSVTGRSIKFVSVQYPIRKLEPLKKILEPNYGVVFVDNEKVFKEAVLHQDYDTYFLDNFAGDFGHLTPKGTEILAINIGKVLINKFF